MLTQALITTLPEGARGPLKVKRFFSRLIKVYFEFLSDYYYAYPQKIATHEFLSSAKKLLARPQKGPLTLSSRVVVRGDRIKTEKRVRIIKNPAELPGV